MFGLEVFLAILLVCFLFRGCSVTSCFVPVGLHWHNRLYPFLTHEAKVLLGVRYSVTVMTKITIALPMSHGLLSQGGVLALEKGNSGFCDSLKGSRKAGE